MTVSEQTALLLEALDYGFLEPDEIIRWADESIAATPNPAQWLIDLSILGKPYKEDVAAVLRQRAETLPLRRTIELVALAWARGLLPVSAALAMLFKITILDREGAQQHGPEDALCDVLVEWECQQDSCVIQPELEARAEAVLRQYLTSAADIARFVPLKRQRRPGPGAAPNGGPATRVGNAGVQKGPPSVS